MKIAIVGLGYVGLPLSLQFARSGVEVLGLDIDAAKADAINTGQSYIKHIASTELAALVQAGRLSGATDFSRIQEVEAVIICVPTPLNRNREPDISFIIETGKAVAPYLSWHSKFQTPNSEIKKLVVLESTTYPGTTDEDLCRVLEAGSGLKAGTDFHLAFSPEREDPGNPQSQLALIPKIVGGFTPACRDRAVALYRSAVKTIVTVSNCRTAESTKLLENVFRCVNIALVNELKVVYGAMGIDIWEVINAAKTKPFGFMPFYPGPGLGGHCIPLDPYYLTWKAREYGQNTRFIELAGEVNGRMPEYVVQRTMEALNDRSKPLKGSKILVLGLAYKADVDDDRESASYRLLEMFKLRGASVDYYDPHIPVIRPSRAHGHWAATRSVVWNREVIASYDVAVVATAHRVVNYEELLAWSPCVVDTRNATAGLNGSNGHVWKA